MTPDEIRDVLRKRNMYVLELVNHNYHVIWDDGRVKYGRICVEYMHRHGVDTLATYNPTTKRFWFKSNAIADLIPDHYLDRMIDHEFSELSEFDPNDIQVAW